MLNNYDATTSGNNEEEWSEFTNNNNIETSDKLSNNFSSQEQAELKTQLQANGNDLTDTDTDDKWCKVTAEQPSGVMNTLLQEPDITQHGDRIFSFAPGEGNRPLGIFMDKDPEFLSFPTIVANVELITVEDLYLFIIEQFVNGNYWIKMHQSMVNNVMRTSVSL